MFVDGYFLLLHPPRPSPFPPSVIFHLLCFYSAQCTKRSVLMHCTTNLASNCFMIGTDYGNKYCIYLLGGTALNLMKGLIWAFMKWCLCLVLWHVSFNTVLTSLISISYKLGHTDGKCFCTLWSLILKATVYYFHKTCFCEHVKDCIETSGFHFKRPNWSF